MSLFLISNLNENRCINTSVILVCLWLTVRHQTDNPAMACLSRFSGAAAWREQPFKEAQHMGPTGNLIRLPFSQGGQSMHFASCAHVEALWWALRRNGAPPTRRSITAARLAEALPHAFILEAQGNEGLRFRLVGSSLLDAAGIDLTTMPFTSLFCDSWFGTAKALCRTALAESATLQMKVCTQSGAWGQIVLLPLSDPRRRLLLGCLEMAHPSALLLNALTIEASGFTRDPDARLHQAAKPAAPIASKQGAISGLAEAPAPFAPAPALMPQEEGPEKRPDAARPALKLISSND
ncbi:PAS domain-containing protein [Pseudoruegeria sp. SHC-113]|uniref:PAS domain-containing protein n=1 Tax=Pseudoruegeria sp. SHC-113 TaxID=2855439 RepID=UPI0021BB721D|nr:PAS domain-containing protein [Pseudoruegeria sp. SHC-113]MCT8160473.1 PAS domain-containing protein [Pseudoruegeria sp. SHC-113]